MPGWRIFVQRNWRVLSRVGAAVVFALVAVLVALPRASAEPNVAKAAISSEDLLLLPERLSSARFAQFEIDGALR